MTKKLNKTFGEDAKKFKNVVKMDIEETVSIYEDKMKD